MCEGGERKCVGVGGGGEGRYGQKLTWCGEIGGVEEVSSECGGCEEVLGEVCAGCRKALVINLEL